MPESTVHYKIAQRSERAPSSANVDEGVRPRRTRRSAAAHQAILAATDELLASVGYHGLTIEEVAARAGVGKTTVYRWWRSKGALVGEALARHLTIGSVPSTGNARTDLLSVVRTTIQNYSGTVAGLVLPTLAADLAHDPEAWNQLVADFLAPRRAVAKTVLRQAIDSGALPPDTDIDLVIDIWGGTVFYRVLLTEGAVDDSLAQQLVDMTLAAPPRRVG
jgi:AcrR family transcriptional regulator